MGTRQLFRLTDANGAPATGFVPGAVIVIRNGVYLAGNGGWSEIDAAHAPGWYCYERAAPEEIVTGVAGVEISGSGLIGNTVAAGDVVLQGLLRNVPIEEQIGEGIVVEDRPQPGYGTSASTRRQPRSRRRAPSGRRR